jgi:hypothetical protein
MSAGRIPLDRRHGFGTVMRRIERSREDVMRTSRKIALGIATVAMAAGIAAVPASSALAASDPKSCTDGLITVCADLYATSSKPGPYGSVKFYPSSTTATGCKLTTWLTFYVTRTGDMWNAPKRTISCDSGLPSKGGQYATIENFGVRSGSTADMVWSNACVDLYYNGSSSSGMQICERTVGVYMP